MCVVACAWWRVRGVPHSPALRATPWLTATRCVGVGGRENLMLLACAFAALPYRQAFAPNFEPCCGARHFAPVCWVPPVGITTHPFWPSSRLCLGSRTVLAAFLRPLAPFCGCLCHLTSCLYCFVHPILFFLYPPFFVRSLCSVFFLLLLLPSFPSSRLSCGTSPLCTTRVRHLSMLWLRKLGPFALFKYEVVPSHNPAETLLKLLLLLQQRSRHCPKKIPRNAEEL